MEAKHGKNFQGIFNKFVPYELETDNLAIPIGISETGETQLKEGSVYGSLVNKLHLIKLNGTSPDEKTAYSNYRDKSPKNFLDLCKMSEHGAHQYDAEDFLYCQKLNFPINRLITLRRFPVPCTDNIFDKFNQAEPDIARMVTYFDQETNKLEELLAFSYNMKWKPLTAEMEQAQMQGDQSGFSGMSKKIMSVIDPQLSQNALRGENRNNYDPKHDQNKVYGPVDSITETNIRDVGLEFTKEFDIQFDYDLKSVNGRTPEYAFKDLIANILAVTYNNGKFWPGSRYWVGERPSKFTQRAQFMNPDSIDEFFTGAMNELKGLVQSFMGPGGKESSVNKLKSVMKNGLGVALGKLLDSVGRPSILVMNSLLSGEPTGFWHLTIGNPDNPIMCIGNLIITGTDIKFPTDSLSYGDFPTKLQVNVKLKPGQPKDKAGIEMMFNHGRSRIYYNPKNVKQDNSDNISKRGRSFHGFDNTPRGDGGKTPGRIDTMINETFDFVGKEGTKLKNLLSSNDTDINVIQIDKDKQINSGNIGTDNYTKADEKASRLT